MFGSHERHRKWLLKSGTAATAEIIEVRGQLTETHHGQDAASFAELGQLAKQLHSGALTREEFNAEVRRLFGQ
jgi:hypothetical protein